MPEESLVSYLRRIATDPAEIVIKKSKSVMQGFRMIKALYPENRVLRYVLLVDPLEIDQATKSSLMEYGVTDRLAQLIVSEAANEASVETGVEKPEVLSTWFSDQYRDLIETAYRADVAAGDISTVSGVALATAVSLLLAIEPGQDPLYRTITNLREKVLTGDFPDELIPDAIAVGIDELSEKEDFRYARELDRLVEERGIGNLVNDQLTLYEQMAAGLFKGYFFGSKILDEFMEWVAIPSIDLLTSRIPFIRYAAPIAVYNLWEISDLGDVNTTTTMGKAILYSQESQ